MNKTPKADRIAHDANTEILANLLIDLDAYTAALVERSSTVETYKRILDRIVWLAESRLDTSFADVLDAKVQITEQLRATHEPDHTRDCIEELGEYRGLCTCHDEDPS